MPKRPNANVRGRLSDGTPNPIDTHVGSRVRLRRSVLGLSQERLAEELGITFQQVQKYEKGLNRIGASRLWDLAQVLGVSADFFYENLDENARNKSPRKVNGLELAEESALFDMDILMRKDVLELLRYYAQISDPKIMKNVLALVKSLSQKGDSES